MRSMLVRWLIGVWLLGLVAWGCGSAEKGDESGSARRGVASVEEEAYVLPPLSEFEDFPGTIAADLTAKSATSGFSLKQLRRTKGASRQSVWAQFGGDPAVPLTQERVVEAFTLLGNNFANVARIVLEFPGATAPDYYVASGAKLDQFLGRDPQTTLTLDDFWMTLERQVIVAEAAEASGAGTATAETHP